MKFSVTLMFVGPLQSDQDWSKFSGWDPMTGSPLLSRKTEAQIDIQINAHSQPVSFLYHSGVQSERRLGFHQTKYRNLWRPEPQVKVNVFFFFVTCPLCDDVLLAIEKVYLPYYNNELLGIWYNRVFQNCVESLSFEYGPGMRWSYYSVCYLKFSVLFLHS